MYTIGTVIVVVVGDVTWGSFARREPECSELLLLLDVLPW